MSQKIVCLIHIFNKKEKKIVKCTFLLFRYFFLSSIVCCWRREPKKGVLFQKYLHRCPLCRVDLETIFVELLGKIFTVENCLPPLMTDPVCLCSEMIIVIFGKTFLWTLSLCISILFYSAEFLYSFSLCQFQVVK